jgi:hypothetical protein
VPWFKVDDTAHSHPKLLKAGNAALGLWLRAGSYAAQHLTEGIVPGVVVQLYGTAPQARKLTAAGLWHEHGHACPRCPQPTPGDYVMHDYLVYNPSRAQEESKRAAAADRQARGRARQRSARENASESSSKTDRFADDSQPEKSESASNQGAFWNESAGQDHLSQRDAQGASRWSRPDPSPTTSYGGSNPPAPRDRPGPAGPAEQMLADWWATYGRQTAQGRASVGRAIADALGNGIEAAELRQALGRLGDLSKPITGGTLQFALADIRKPPPGAAVIPLGTAPSARPSTTDQRVAEGMALAARLRAQEAAQ